MVSGYFWRNGTHERRSRGPNAFDQLDLMAAEVPAGSDGLIALPHLQGSGPPHLNANARTLFGMTIAHGKEHFVRAIMESVVMVLCRIIEATEALDISVDRIISFGGGALSPVWCQMKADATGKDVVTTKNNKSAGCLGAGILAGVACGIGTQWKRHVIRSYRKNGYITRIRCINQPMTSCWPGINI